MAMILPKRLYIDVSSLILHLVLDQRSANPSPRAHFRVACMKDNNNTLILRKFPRLSMRDPGELHYITVITLSFQPYTIKTGD